MSPSKQGDVANEKEVAFYTAIVDAWVGSSMERDRSILYIASGAIGLLITLATTAQAFTRWEFLFYFISLTAFLATIIIVLFIFQRNKEFLTRLKEDSECPADKRKCDSGDPVLCYLDKALLTSFGIGVVFAFGIAVINLNNHVITKEKCMEDKLENSLNGLNKMSPKNEGRSLNGMEALRPKPAQPPTDTPPPADKPAAPTKKD
ncbi:MAG: hypothetical protein PHV36_14375 [Elusimicrobiales bacterium]|nr:hypothetical protein [Elusimicrobiales bacterium]